MHRAGPWTSQIFLPQHRTFCPNEEKASTVHASCKTLGCMGSMLANIVRLVSSCGHVQTRQFWHRVPWGRRVLLHETSLYFILAGRSWFTGGCQSHSLANGFSRIRTMAPRKESQRLIHYANPLQPVKHHTLWISQALSRSCSPPSCKGRVFGRRRIAEAVRGRWHYCFHEPGFFESPSFGLFIGFVRVCSGFSGSLVVLENLKNNTNRAGL